MKRKEAVAKIMSTVTDELCIVSTGFLCRDVFEKYDRNRNFYMSGSMGNALGIGIGIAMNNSDKKVIVISGDGATLMSLGSSVLLNFQKLPNIKHYVVDNGTYNSTGGQPSLSKFIDLSQFENTEVIRVQPGDSPSPRISLSHEDILVRFKESLKK